MNRFPWCDTCHHAAVYSEIFGFLHSTPEHPFGHPRHSDPFGDHNVTMREWNRTPDVTHPARERVRDVLVDLEVYGLGDPAIDRIIQAALGPGLSALDG